MRRSQKTLVFPGRFPRSEFKRSKNETKVEVERVLGIGILGSVNDFRRDYAPLIKAVDKLSIMNIWPKIFFLGSYVSERSQLVIESFAKCLAFSPSKESPYVEENIIEGFIEQIDVLIAPFSESWGYENGRSSGSIADSYYYQRPLLLPAFARCSYGDFEVNFYANENDLVEKLVSWRSLLAPSSEYFTASEILEFLES